MKINDLVVVTKNYHAKVRYEDPDCIIDTYIGIGSTGLILGIQDDYAYIYFQSINFGYENLPSIGVTAISSMKERNATNGGYFVSFDNLRVIGSTTKEQFFGYPTIDYKKVIKYPQEEME